eukprot:g6240.t1
MTSSNALWCAIFTLVLTFAQGEVTLSDFTGVWRGYFPNIITAILTPQGPRIVCVDELPKECAAQLGLVEDTYTINGTTLSLEVRVMIGITTREQSAEATPACAKSGIYPIETRAAVPVSQIMSYNSKAERIFYIDPRRPDDINCLPAKYRIGEKGPPYIEMSHIVIFKGSLLDSVTRGASFRCEILPQTCRIEEDNKGELDAAFQEMFILTCIAGDCLNAMEAPAPSASHGSSESQVDV